MNESFANGRYQVTGRLGQGGMGAVFEARDIQNNRTVALKVVPSAGSKELQARFEREGQALTNLNHPNIVSVLDAGSENGQRFIVMEYLAGRSLNEVMAAQPHHRLPTDRALDITRQISQALDHAHSRQVLHRDIKPANIMVGDDGRVKLMDFGVAKSLGLTTLTQTGDVVGTTAYMAPEQALGDDLDARTDLYSLGCVLFEMVAGRRPFPGDNAARLIYSHIHDTPSWPRQVAVEISPALDSLVFKLLDKDPECRYQTAAEVLGAIEQVESQSDPHAVAMQAAERRWATVMVGRETESKTLERRLDAAQRGEGHLIFLTGEAGIGKTRLAGQLEVYASMRGARFLSGRARHHGERVPYRPWLDVERQALRQTSADVIADRMGQSANDLARLFPELAVMAIESPEAVTTAQAQQSQQLFEAVSSFLIALSQDKPLVLFLDDLQWSDDASLQLLRHLSEEILSERILIVGAYRDDEIEGGSMLDQITAGIQPEAKLPLKRLNAEQTVEKIRKTFGRQELPELEAIVCEKTNGNPLFIEELLRSLLATDHISLEDGVWQVKDLNEAPMPEGIRAVIQQRLARLSEPTREMLTMAAIIGRQFRFATLQALLEMEEDRLVALVDEALQAHVLVEGRVPGEEVYVFSDAPVRDVLHESVSPARRQRLHLKVGQAMEQVCKANEEEWAEALAYHFLQGNDKPRAIAYSIKAGDNAVAVFAWSEAIDRYRTALELLTDEESQQKATVLDNLTVASMALGDADTALEYAKLALALYEKLGDRQKEMEIHMHIQSLYTSGFWDGAREDEALHHLEAAATIADEFPDSVEQGLIYQRTAHLYLHRSDPEKAKTLTQKAVDLFERLDVTMGTALGTALAYTGQIDSGVAYSEGNWENVHKLKNPLIMAVFGHELALVLALARNVPKAREWGERVLAQVENTGPVFEGFLRRPLVLIYTLSGQADKVAEARQRQLEVEEQTLLGCYFEDAASIGLSYLRSDEREKSRAYLEQAIQAHQIRNTSAAVGACSFALGTLELDEGDYEAAERRLRTSLDISRSGGNVLFELWILPVLAEMYLAKDQPEAAAETLKRAFGLLTPDQNWYGLPAPLYLVKGMLNGGRKQWAEAENAFEQSLALNRQYEMPWDEARVLLEWGNLHGRRREKDEARRKLDSAITIFERLGATQQTERALAAKAALDASWLSRLRGRAA